MSAVAGSVLRVEEASLVAAMARGEAEALGVLFDRYSGLLLGLATRMLGRLEEAEELVHEVFVEAWRKAAAFDPKRGIVRAWLVTRTRSRALDRIRSPRRGRTRLVADPPRDAVDNRAPDPSAGADRERLARALASLSEGQRRVIELAYFSGLSSSEISNQLDIPIGTVKSRTAAGLRRLRAELACKE